MKTRSFQAHLLFMCIAFADVASAGQIQVTVKPIKLSYILGEPVVCDFAIKNVSPQDLAVGLNYPNRMGLCLPGHEPPIPVLASDADGIVPLVRFAANEEYRVKIVLNRYMVISRPGKYRLRYAATYVVSPASEGRKGPFRQVSEDGILEFAVVEGVLGDDRFKSFADALDQEDSHAVLEAIEMLIWIDDARVVSCLQKASRTTFAKSTALELVNARWTILYGLAKFLHLEDARTAFFWIAGQSDAGDMAIAYQICMAKNIQVPDAIVKGGLGSSGGWRRCSSLEYLLRCGTPAQAEWVVPLTKDESPNIRALAEKVLAKFKEDAEKKKGK